jgi:hypothetical protein
LVQCHKKRQLLVFHLLLVLVLELELSLQLGLCRRLSSHSVKQLVLK